MKFINDSLLKLKSKESYKENYNLKELVKLEDELFNDGRESYKNNFFGEYYKVFESYQLLHISKNSKNDKRFEPNSSIEEVFNFLKENENEYLHLISFNYLYGACDINVKL